MSDNDRAPIAVGGVGGSGTRVVAQVLNVLGIALGADLNPAWDNLSFALLMKHARWFGSPAKRRERAGAALSAFERATTAGGEALSTRQRLTVVRAALATAAFERGFAGRERWALERARRLLGAQPPLRPGSAWGWKEPNTHIFLPELAEQFPGLRYIHVIRNGLEVAGGANQAQLLRWGSQFGVNVPAHADLVQASLRYWARANTRAVEIGRQALGDRFMLLDFNRLCHEPESTAHDLLGFLGLSRDSIAATELRSIIDPERARRSLDPGAMGQVSAEDLRALRRFGY